MFYPKSNNTQQQVNLNTTLYTSYSETAQVTAGAWNNQLSIKIKPCIGQDGNGIRQYAEDKSQVITTSITPENAICLIEGFDAIVLPALKGEKASGSVSIAMGAAEQRKILTVGYENGNAYLSIAVALDETGKAGGELRHIFNKKGYLVDYKPSVGNAVENIVEADLINFMDKVRSVKDLAPVIAHSIKYNELSRAAFTPNNGNTNNTTGNTYANNNMSGNTMNNYQAPVSNATSMDDFLPF